jgi:hypothetical protein
MAACLNRYLGIAPPITRIIALDRDGKSPSGRSDGRRLSPFYGFVSRETKACVARRWRRGSRRR